VPGLQLGGHLCHGMNICLVHMIHIIASCHQAILQKWKKRIGLVEIINRYEKLKKVTYEKSNLRRHHSIQGHKVIELYRQPFGFG
jgi:hypothetical protein